MSEHDPDYEERLRRRLELLQKEFEDGKIFISSEVGDEVTKSLLAVRSDATGQVDLSTVDGIVRSMALAVEGLKWREDVKSVNSLRDINEEYFRNINVQFGELYGTALQRGLSIHEAAKILASDPERREYVCGIIPEFVEGIRHFWSIADDATIFHLQDFAGLKAVFGGDLFPTSSGSTIRTSAIYADTAIVPDPFLQSEHLFQRSEDHIKVYYFFKAALNLCSVARLALADVNPPIVCVLPHPSHLSEGRRDFVKFEMNRLGLLHASRIFGRSFKDIDELFSFGATLETTEQLAAAIADSNRLLFDTAFDGPLEEQLKLYVKNMHVPLPALTPGQLIAIHCSGRMSQASDLLLKSRELHGAPLIDAPTSWAHFRWCLEYVADKDQDGHSLVDDHVLHALGGDQSSSAAWLGDVPEDALIEMRRSEAMHEIRERLGAGLDAIVNRNSADFASSSAQVYANLDEWMNEHQQALKDLEKAKLKFAGIDIASCVVYGAVEIASAIGIPGVSLINTFIDQAAGTPKLKALPEKYEQLKDQARALSNSTAGIFFAAKSGAGQTD